MAQQATYGTADTDEADNSNICIVDTNKAENPGTLDGNRDNNSRKRRKPSEQGITSNTVRASIFFLRRTLFFIISSFKSENMDFF